MHPPSPFYGGLRGITSNLHEMSLLLSGKGTVNVKSSVSVITAHTGMSRSDREGRAWQAHAQASLAVTETKVLAVQCSQ